MLTKEQIAVLTNSEPKIVRGLKPTIKPGEKIVCMIESNDHRPIFKHYKFPKIYETYTVRGTNLTGGVYLEEIVNPEINTDMGMMEAGIGSGDFVEFERLKEFIELEKMKPIVQKVKSFNNKKRQNLN